MAGFDQVTMAAAPIGAALDAAGIGVTAEEFVVAVAIGGAAVKAVKASNAFAMSETSKQQVDCMDNTYEDSICFYNSAPRVIKVVCCKVWSLGLGITIPPEEINVYCLDRSGPQGHHWRILRETIVATFLSTNAMSVEDVRGIIDAYNEGGVKCGLDCGPNKTNVRNDWAEAIYDLYVHFTGETSWTVPAGAAAPDAGKTATPALPAG